MTDQPTYGFDRALLTEATKKAAIVWLTVGDRPAYPVWCLSVGASLYVVTGPGEQPAPGLASASTVRVSARGDHGGLIVTWTANVARVAPGTDVWSAIAPQLASKRLNAPEPADTVVNRWARECTLLGLDPADE